MGRPLYLTAFVALIATATAIEPQTCPGPNEWFTAEFVALADVLINVSDSMLVPDVNLHFFREIMHFSEKEIEDVTEEALDFFNTKYGLNFLTSAPDQQGRRFFENAIFYAFEFSPAVQYTITFNRWLINGRTKSTCFPNRDGGFGVFFTAEQTLRGTYGGVEGKPIRPGEMVVWGFYNIPVCPQQPLVIQYSSGTPFRSEPIDGFTVINCDLNHRELGTGSARGIAIATPSDDDPNIIHWSIRNLFTFPANPGLP